MCVRKKARDGVSEWPRGVGILSPEAAERGQLSSSRAAEALTVCLELGVAGDPCPLSHTKAHARGANLTAGEMERALQATTNGSPPMPCC